MKIDGFVLTGGASSRMGGDKSLLEIERVPLAERARKTLGSICESVHEVGGDRSASSSILPDIRRLPNGGHASIIGVHSALSYSRSEWTAILACDLPFVRREFLEFLVSKSIEITDEAGAVVPVQSDGRRQPLCALYRTKDCLPAVESAIDHGSLSLFRLLENIDTRFVEHWEYRGVPNSDHVLFNVNTPADLERARSLF